MVGSNGRSGDRDLGSGSGVIGVERPVTFRDVPTRGVGWLARAAFVINNVLFRARTRGQDDPLSDSLLWVVALVFAYGCITIVAILLVILGGTVLNGGAPRDVHDVLFNWVSRPIMVFGFAGIVMNVLRFEVIFYRRKARRDGPYGSDRYALGVVPTDLVDKERSPSSRFGTAEGS
jgi:hypothetical protein